MTHTDKFRTTVRERLAMGVRASEIARRSGLAPTTISYVLHHDGDVTYETAMRILSAIKQIKPKRK